jgi:hypothetical protein
MASPAHPIDLKDITTPAHERIRTVAVAGEGPDQTDRPDRYDPVMIRRVGPAGNLTLLAGIWLVISGITLNYHETGMFDAYWSDLVVGVALAVIALVCLVKPVVTGSLMLTRLALGGWLMAAPVTLGYGDIAKPCWNDVTVGVAVIMLAALGSGTGQRAGGPA